ncbi:14221_t:CDS:1, partial [Dentiscutata heterogama]
DCNVSESNSNNRVWSDSETEVMKYVASNKKKSKYKIRRFILGSTSGNESDSSCGSSTITDDSCTITGDTSQDECGGVFDDWPILLQELSPSTDDSSSENIKKKRRKLVNHLVACRVCGGPELICNFICVCVACNEGYHQKCHDPQISHFKIGEKWRCIDCQNALRNKSSLIFKKSINRVMNDSMSSTHLIKENDQQSVDNCDDSTTITNISTIVNGKNLYDINSSNDDDSIQKQRSDFFQQRTANKCLNGYNNNLIVKKDRKEVDNKGLDKDTTTLPYPRTKTITSPKKRNRSLLPLILPPSEKRHSTTTELRRLFDNCPMSIVNFDEVFKPEEWSKCDDVVSSSRVSSSRNSSSSSENKSLISLRKKSVVSDKGAVILNKSTSSPGKSSVSTKSITSSSMRHVTSSTKSVTSSSIRHITSKRSTSLGKKAVTSINKRYDPSDTSDVSHNEPDSIQDLISSIDVFSPPVEKSPPNVKAITKSIDALNSKNGMSSSKSVGITENDTNFNITSLLPLNLIPCLNFDALAFREGTIDVKRGQVKRGKVYPVLR